MLKDIFKISVTIIFIGLCSAALLNDLLQHIIIFFNTYLDGMFQFIQYFSGLANCEYILILVAFFIITIFVSIFVK